jgi:hypothetical protein
MAKRNIFGLIYDERTGKVTYEDGEVPAVGANFTFENHAGYNPLQFATDKTAAELVEILAANFPQIEFAATKTKPEGPVAPPAANQIRASRNGISESFNAGLIANSLIRNGNLISVRAEFKAAGLLY